MPARLSRLFGTILKPTPVIDIGNKLTTPTVTANCGILTTGTVAGSKVTFNVWPNATWNSALITGGTGSMLICNALNTTTTINVENGAVWNIGQAATGGIATNVNFANFAPTAGNPTTAKLNIAAGGTVNVTGGIFMTANVDSATARPQGDIDIYGTFNTGAGTTLQLGRRGESTFTIFSGGKMNNANGGEMQAGYTRIWVKDGGEFKSTSGSFTMSRYRASLNAANRNSEAKIDCEGIFGIFGGNLNMCHDATAKAAINVSGNGKMRVGHSSSSRSLYTPNNTGAEQAIVNVSGGRLTVSGSVTRASGTLATNLVRSFTMSGGETNVRTFTGGTTEVGTLTHSGGVLSPAAYVLASDSYNEVLKTDIAVPYNQTTTAATIQIDIAGTTASTGTAGTGFYDVIASTSTMAVQGPLKVIFRDNFQQSVGSGNTFTVITCTGGITGSFSNVVGGKVKAYLPDGVTEDGEFTVTQTANSVVLSNYYSPNLAPVITLTDAYTYLGAGPVAISPVVTDENIGTVAYLWSIVSQPVGSSCVINPNTTTKNITVTTDMVGDYVLSLKATDSAGKFSSAPVTIHVLADACAAAQHMPSYIALKGDENSNCKVDFIDFALLAGNWNKCNNINCP
jgi:hypothetical protein